MVLTVTLKANSIIAHSAVRVQVSRGQNYALAVVVKRIARVARRTFTGTVVENAAEGVNLNTNFFFVEVVTWVAVDAGTVQEGFALNIEIVLNHFEVCVDWEIVFFDAVLCSRGRNFRLS